MKKLMWFKLGEPIPADAVHLKTIPARTVKEINIYDQHLTHGVYIPEMYLYEVPVSAPATIPSPPHDGAGYFGEDK